MKPDYLLILHTDFNSARDPLLVRRESHWKDTRTRLTCADYFPGQEPKSASLHHNHLAEVAVKPPAFKPRRASSFCKYHLQKQGHVLYCNAAAGSKK